MIMKSKNISGTSGRNICSCRIDKQNNPKSQYYHIKSQFTEKKNTFRTCRFLQFPLGMVGGNKGLNIVL